MDKGYYIMLNVSVFQEERLGLKSKTKIEIEGEIYKTQLIFTYFKSPSWKLAKEKVTFGRPDQYYSLQD